MESSVQYLAMIFHILLLLVSFNTLAVEKKFCFYSSDPGWSELQSLNAQAHLMHVELLESGQKSHLETDLRFAEVENCMIVVSGPKLMKRIQDRYNEVMGHRPKDNAFLSNEFDVVAASGVLLSLLREERWDEIDFILKKYPVNIPKDSEYYYQRDLIAGIVKSQKNPSKGK